MSKELGKIHKPDAEKFKQGRKLFLVPLLYEGSDAPPEYTEKCSEYWEQVRAHLNNLELKLGSIKRIYHEIIIHENEEGLKALDTINRESATVVRDKYQKGAELVIIEDKELAEENMDWERCLLMGFISNKVAGIISDYYRDSSRKRYEYISSRIDKTLEENEAAILFIREGHMVQFPRDIEVFNIAPPALNDVHRWLRDQSSHKSSQSDESSSSE